MGMEIRRIYLRRDGFQFLLPVTPESIIINDDNRIVKTDLLSLGEVSQLGSKPLRSITFTSFFPEFMDSYVNVTKPGLDVDSPRTWVDRINGLKNKTFLCIITNMIVFRCYIQSFQYSSVGGQGKDINYTLSLIEVKFPSVRSINLDQLGESPPTQVTLIPFIFDSPTYIVQRGDTLAIISRKTKIPMTTISSYNNIIDSSVLAIGRVLNLPVFDHFYDIRTNYPGN
jgi:hypothetical protein